MKAQITSIEHFNDECIKITALVYLRRFPRPNYEDNETDAQYFTRVLPIAQEIDAYDNLHIGWVELKQGIETTKIPTVAEYDS